MADEKDQDASESSGEDETMLEASEIEALFSQTGGGAASDPAPTAASSPPAPSPPASPAPSAAPASSGDSIAQDDIELLLNQAEQALASVTEENEALPEGVKPFALRDFAGAPASSETATFDLVRDVELGVKIELGRTHMYLEDVLKLRKGSVVPLDKLAGDPVDVYVNGRLVARGEVLVLNDNFCVRVAELIAGESAVA